MSAGQPVTPHPLTIVGNEGSPYSRKMRALLRYRHIPHRWVVRHGPEFVAPPKLPLDLIPVLIWHDAAGKMREAMVDSTPQIRRLEQEYRPRSVLPPNAGLVFLNDLIEDYADEWCTKYMFHYRWANPAGVAWARSQLMREINPAVPAAQLEKLASEFAERQTGRLALVGSSAENAPLIEAGYRRLLEVLETLLTQRLFLFGQRPASADFALYGQLVQLCHWDPTPAQIAREVAPRVVAWTQRLEDLSGWPEDPRQWLHRDAVLTGVMPLLREIGRTYVPFMLANAAARTKQAQQMECQIDGAPWRQQVSPYQFKCLLSLRQQFVQMPAEDGAWAWEALVPAGCATLLSL
jgi:glutathione S-transferase